MYRVSCIFALIGGFMIGEFGWNLAMLPIMLSAFFLGLSVRKD